MAGTTDHVEPTSANKPLQAVPLVLRPSVNEGMKASRTEGRSFEEDESQKKDGKRMLERFGYFSVLMTDLPSTETKCFGQVLEWE